MRIEAADYSMDMSSSPLAQTTSPLPIIHPMERAARAWLGHIAADKPELEARCAGLDRLGHAMLASLTNGMPPASLVKASTDWASISRWRCTG